MCQFYLSIFCYETLKCFGQSITNWQINGTIGENSKFEKASKNVAKKFYSNDFNDRPCNSYYVEK